MIIENYQLKLTKEALIFVEIVSVDEEDARYLDFLKILRKNNAQEITNHCFMLSFIDEKLLVQIKQSLEFMQDKDCIFILNNISREATGSFLIPQNNSSGITVVEN